MKKGITATSVTVLVVIILILAGTITTVSYSSVQNAKKIVFSLEISSIQETVDKYMEYGDRVEYPILTNQYLLDLLTVSSDAMKQFEGENIDESKQLYLYELDLGALGITDTTYGNKKTEKDIYVISEYTGRVYYIQGIKCGSTTYYTLTDDLLNLQDKKVSINEQLSSIKPIISTDGFVTKNLSGGAKKIYLTNISVKNDPKVFKYEIGIIPLNIAKEYFSTNGKDIVSDRLSFSEAVNVTLYAESQDGEYDVVHCVYTNAQ